MKELKVGSLVFKKKAVFLTAFCLFLNGMLIGAMVAYKQENAESLNFLPFYILFFLPYLLVIKPIKQNIVVIPHQALSKR